MVVCPVGTGTSACVCTCTAVGNTRVHLYTWNQAVALDGGGHQALGATSNRLGPTQGPVSGTASHI